jgi:hypothetical protein
MKGNKSKNVDKKNGSPQKKRTSVYFIEDAPQRPHGGLFGVEFMFPALRSLKVK